MAIHLYEDITLTQRISEGDLANPDDDTYNGTDGEAKDKELFVANEQTILAAALASGATSLQLSAPCFTDGEIIIVDEHGRVPLVRGDATQAFDRRPAGGLGLQTRQSETRRTTRPKGGTPHGGRARNPASGVFGGRDRRDARRCVMRVLIRNTALNGQPLDGDGEVFTGETVMDVIQAMKGSTLFSDQRDLEDYIDMVLRNAKMLSGVELTVRGDTPEEKAASFLDALIKHGLAEVQDDKPARIPIPALVWQGIDAVRLSGLTNMLDRPVVARLAEELGYPDTARWIEDHPKEYAEGVFRGFIVDSQGGKP